MKSKMYLIAMLSSFYPERTLFIIYYLSIGLSITNVVLIQGIISGLQFILEVPTGVLSDKIGRKKTLCLSAFFIILYYLLLVISSDFKIILIANIFYGVGLTFASGASESYIYEEIGDYEAVYRKFTTIASISLGVSILIGGIFSLISWKLLFLIAVIIHTLSLVTMLMLEEDFQKNNNLIVKKGIKLEILEYFQYLKTLFIDDNKIIILSFIIIDSFFWFFYMAYQVELQNIGFNSFTIAIIYAIVSLVVFIINIKERKLESSTLMKSNLKTIILMLIMCMIILLTNKGSNIISILILMLSQIYIYQYIPYYSQMVHDQLPKKHRNKLISTIYSLSSIIIWLLFVVYGVLVNIFNTNVIYVMFIVVLVMLIILTIRPNNIRNDK